ncbi:MAG: amino acid permease [Gemmatimonadota bacterium]|nr:amino acid permease [Gemmatimonadota bacterium]MDH3424263.1 amino acid permease [Gemmatimonadota bacterium]
MATQVTLPKPVKLQKQLGLWDVYALATGATLSSGFFLLPGLAAAGAGSAMPVSYLLAALILLPGLLSSVELTTAMPKAGGVYYFLDRSMGPLVGTIGGFGTWIALVLKASFALYGVGAYLQLFFPQLEMGPVAGGFAILFGVINYFGAKKTGTFQVMLLIGLSILLLWFCGLGVLQMDASNFGSFFETEASGLIATSGLVVVSYMGLTKVSSVAEEVKNPERNLPLGTFLSFGTVILVYVIGTSVMVGVASAETLGANGGDLKPVATVAQMLAGPAGAVVMTIAALLAVSSGANAGVLSASRYPLAMGRDRILPDFFGRVGARGTPAIGIAATVGLILLCVTLFDPTKIAKLASAFKLVMFALGCLAVIVMRESRIESYDPGYKSPFYPVMQILGILAPFWLIVEMGFLPTLFTAGLITLGAMWYTYYASSRVDREGAIFHVFERLGRQRDERLDLELREVIKDRGPRAEDPFDTLFTAARVLDLDGPVDFEVLVRQASERLARDLPVSASSLFEGFLKGARLGATPVSHGAALPHVRLDAVEEPQLLLARVRNGVELGAVGPEPDDPVRAIFFLVGPQDDPGRHLRILAQIARRVDQDAFMPEWLAAEGTTQIKEALFRNERLLVMKIGDGLGEELVGSRLRELALPDGTLIAMIRRQEEMVIPQGDTVLQFGDRLTILGRPEGIAQLRLRFSPAAR